jgi:hypothetical protein
MKTVRFNAVARVNFSASNPPDFPVLCEASASVTENQISRRLAQLVAEVSPESFDAFFGEPAHGLTLWVHFKGQRLRVIAWGSSREEVGATDFPSGVDIRIHLNDLARLKTALRMSSMEVLRCCANLYSVIDHTHRCRPEANASS